MVLQGVEFPAARIRELCERRSIRRLAVFGSLLREGQFGPDSDIDMLVEFVPGARVGLIGFAAIENELSDLLGRRVDLNTAGFLGPSLAPRIAAQAEDVYVRR